MVLMCSRLARIASEYSSFGWQRGDGPASTRRGTDRSSTDAAMTIYGMDRYRPGKIGHHGVDQRLASRGDGHRDYRPPPVHRRYDRHIVVSFQDELDDADVARIDGIIASGRSPYHGPLPLPIHARTACRQTRKSLDYPMPTPPLTRDKNQLPDVKSSAQCLSP